MAPAPATHAFGRGSCGVIDTVPALAHPAVVALVARLPGIAARAAALDCDGAFPAEDVAALAEAGLLTAPLPVREGGHGLGTASEGAAGLVHALRLIGRASLPLGRLYEGHVNALRLVLRDGTPAQRAAAARDAMEGRLFAVWNTDAPGEPPLGMHATGPGRWRLEGRKVLCSGAGRVGRALVTAFEGGDTVRPARMLLLTLPQDGGRADLASWTAQGMRASATGAVEFTGLEIGADSLLGSPGAYLRQPDFSAGAWRFAAVQLGGAEALAEALRQHLRRTGRGADPHQAARLGQVAIALETGRLWVEAAAQRAERPGTVAPDVFVNLARTAIERAALDILELVQRSVGLAAFLRPAPMERIARDLATYLRQPAPDRALAEAAARVLTAQREIGDLWA
jgi:alkylation response protein AidB-like acyl-CoA dehydrogenase